MVNIPIPEKVINDYERNRGCHPGIVLKNLLVELGMSQRQLAIKVDRPYQAINEIVRCRKQITADTALQFETALPGTAHFWMDIQVAYDILVACQKRANERPFSQE